MSADKRARTDAPGHPVELEDRETTVLRRPGLSPRTAEYDPDVRRALLATLGQAHAASPPQDGATAIQAPAGIDRQGQSTAGTAGARPGMRTPTAGLLPTRAAPRAPDLLTRIDVPCKSVFTQQTVHARVRVMASEPTRVLPAPRRGLPRRSSLRRQPLLRALALAIGAATATAGVWLVLSPRGDGSSSGGDERPGLARRKQADRGAAAAQSDADPGRASLEPATDRDPPRAGVSRTERRPTGAAGGAARADARGRGERIDGPASVPNAGPTTDGRRAALRAAAEALFTANHRRARKAYARLAEQGPDARIYGAIADILQRKLDHRDSREPNPQRGADRASSATRSRSAP